METKGEGQHLNLEKKKKRSEPDIGGPYKLFQICLPFPRKASGGLTLTYHTATLRYRNANDLKFMRCHPLKNINQVLAF